MTLCTSCGKDAPGDSATCPHCGAPFVPSTSAPTQSGTGDDPPPVWPSPGPDSARFIPGTIVDGRYRMVGLLGRGGMGEVYRADDLKLGRSVALKFLPADVIEDRERLDRFLNEVRTSLTVTHPNVCRVHDIGEVDGQHYLSMEFVDGEDLGSLLRRIGRLPETKAVEIARQLCSGLAAAHEQGILHRDLKPANVMIDGRGRAKLTDFGLATLAAQVDGNDLRAGTPLYMSPEQFAGREVTVSSDIYSLGLILYELFTGRRAFDAATGDELRRIRDSSTPTSPSSHVTNLDPAVERTILRCLESDPQRRPVSALAVAGSLPGGDPLAAALAAGETPSPEMVANAGETGALPPWIGAALLSFVLLGLIGTVLGQAVYSVPARVGLDKPPQALVVEAREVLELAGHRDRPRDRMHGFTFDPDYFAWVESKGILSTFWEDVENARPAPIVFWYGESPQPFPATSLFSELGDLSERVPNVAWNVDDMAGVWLDPQGQLLRFLIVPPAFDRGGSPSGAVDWSPYFAAAGLDTSGFEETAPHRNPPVACDSRWAWQGFPDDRRSTPLRIEACSTSGRPIHFEVIPPWRNHTWSEPETQSSAGETIFLLCLLAAIVIGGPLVARRNLRLGRGDRRGAYRLATFMFGVTTITVLLLVHHVPSLAEIGLLFESVGYALVIAALVWIVYIALEPYARRLWPDSIIAWSRLLAGRFRDPLVGRDILIGAAFGVFNRGWWYLHAFIQDRLSLPVDRPAEIYLGALASPASTVGNWLDTFAWSIQFALGWLFLAVLMQLVIRKRGIVVAAFMILWIGTWVPMAQNPLFFGAFALVVFAAFMVVLLRFGLLATMAWGFFLWQPLSVPLSLDLASWYFGTSVFTLLIPVAVAAYAFWISLAGRPLMQHDPLDHERRSG